MRATLLLLTLTSCSVRQREYQALSDPNDAEAWEKLGDAYRARFKGQRAADAYREALRIDPSREHLATRLSSGRESREARELRREVMRYPNDDEMWGDLGDLLRYDGDLLGARQAFLRAYRIDPHDSEWHTALIELGAGEAVLDTMAEGLIETDDESLGDYADLLTELGRADEACEYYRRAAEIDPYDAEWIEPASRCGYEVPDPHDGHDTGGYGGMGHEAEYVARFRELPDADDIPGLVQRIDNDAGLLIRLGQAYLKADDRTKAEETLWGALLVAPTDEEAVQSYLVATRMTRREVLEKLRATFPDDDEVVGALADHYLDLGLRDRARDLYDLAHSLDEDDPEWKAKKALLAL